MIRAYSISADDIAAERERVDNDLSKVDISRVIKQDTLELYELKPRDVHLRILAVSAEHNIAHAALADTLDITKLRGGKIYPGNSAVAEVIGIGSEVTTFNCGDIVVTHCNGEPDKYGYPLRIWAYDQPESVGWYAEEAIVGDWQIIKAPLDCGLNLWQMAALPLRAPTAYRLWLKARGIFRVDVSAEECPTLNVLGFGGGVSELFLMLAAHKGHNAFFCSGTPERLAALKELGITPIDQQEFKRFAGPEHIKAFGKRVKELTDGEGMHLVCDLMRGPVFTAGIVAMSRMGVNVSAGWQLSKQVTYDSAGLSVKQETLGHTHYASIQQCHEATALYGRVFVPTVHREVYPFYDLPRAMDELQRNVQTGIPIVRVADHMPKSVEHLL